MQTPTAASGPQPQAAIPAATDTGGEQPKVVGVEAEMTAGVTADPVAPAELPKHTLFVDIGAPSVPVVAVPVEVASTPASVAPTTPVTPTPEPVAPPPPIRAAPTATPPVPAPAQQSVPPQAGSAPSQAPVSAGQKGGHILALGLYDEALAALKGKSSPQEVALDLMYFLTESLTLVVGLAANGSESTAKAFLQITGATFSNANPAKLLETVNTAMSARLMESFAPKK